MSRKLDTQYEENFKFHKSLRENPSELKKHQRCIYEALLSVIEGIDENIADVIMEYMNCIWGVGDIVKIQYCNIGGSYKRLCTIEARLDDRIYTSTARTRIRGHWSNITETPEFIWFYDKGAINYNQCWKAKYINDQNVMPDCAFYIKNMKEDRLYF